ncbi:MAG: acyl-CoA dehydrogenase C-terminal domain-containing protein [Alphaproteobacteria bacterium]|nr:acyl-CoA dehydrogenase C-terminal domain-containing protein [Alphaproteobacteria bacterium]
MQEFTQPLAKAYSDLRRMTSWIVNQSLTNPQNVAAAASDYLHLFALVALARMWSEMVEVSLAALVKAREESFYRTKIATARFYMRYLLPRSSSLIKAIMSSCRLMIEIDAEAF